MEVEPLAGKRHVAVTERRTRKDWAHQIKSMLDKWYPAAIRVRLIRTTSTRILLLRSMKPLSRKKLVDWGHGLKYITLPSMGVGLITMNRNILQGAVHSFYLPIRPWMVEFRQAMLNVVLSTDPIKGMTSVYSCRA